MNDLVLLALATLGYITVIVCAAVVGTRLANPRPHHHGRK